MCVCICVCVLEKTENEEMTAAGTVDETETVGDQNYFSGKR